MIGRTTTWRQDIERERKERGDDVGPLVGCTLSEEQMDAEFDPRYDHYEDAVNFTAWTEARVYFATQYDGATDTDSVPRHPCDEADEHISSE